MILALVQMSNVGDIQCNLKKCLTAIHEAVAKGADMVLFPEVQLTEFFPQYKGRDVKSYGVELSDDIVLSFKKACKDNHIMEVPNNYLKENSNFMNEKGKRVWNIE